VADRRLRRGGLARGARRHDRERLAGLLGFSGPITHTRDAMWQADGFAEATWHAATAATNASRFADDAEIFGSDEFGLLRIGDELCRASALMPQKRNPYALVVIRGGARTLLGRATGVLATQLTPSGRTDNLLYAYGEVAGSVELATRLMNLAAVTAASIEFAEKELPAATLATDQAEQLSLDTGLDYRSAYKRVAQSIEPSDPREAIATRTVTGGAAPEALQRMLDDCRATIASARERLAAERAGIEAAEHALLAMAQ